MSTIRYTLPWTARQAAQAGLRHADLQPGNLRQVFERFLGATDNDASTAAKNQWTPRVDIREEEARFVILADIPGVDPAAVEVQMDKGVLTIKGERSGEASDDGKRWSRVERAHGAFERRFVLPDSADADGITAAGKLGVLEIRIPKKAEQQPRRIQVQ